jgi:hypothetical protein
MIIVLCEGQTEERFIKEVVIPTFSHLYIVPKIIMTKGGKKGGSIHYEDFLKQVKQILHNTQVTLLLTMFDLAGIPSSWWNGIKSNCPKCLNDKFKKDIKDARFYPLWMIYEFEIVAFIAPKKTGEVVGYQYVSALEKVLKNNQHNPEAIDHDNYPSKHLVQICGKHGYQKILDGVSIAKKLSLEQLKTSKSFARLFDKLAENE